ncbi:hypothetical protein L21SP3_00085 [Sedimentisphaera cyanobacteriorum]|uniref:Uncharacterized protein n=1 Tax=Sedimentisphaera cyanobacteriorum TaxID=1940790 RepID=A0A1Q2HL50_9BACT|nr:hypothetical protein [Sedimentisphaera cyanobacteriorum]AQQ08309.1 hypothetical protein L21SP3_00085 [Sedimentisphaera cyanobacteriorum]
MQDKEKIKKYIEKFINTIKTSLKPDISINATAYPAEEVGGVLEFDFVKEKNQEPSIAIKEPLPTLAEAVNSSNQTLVGFAGEGTNFTGTNISLQIGKLVLIKGTPSEEKQKEEDLWSEEAAEKDVERINKLVESRRKAISL